MHAAGAWRDHQAARLTQIDNAILDTRKDQCHGDPDGFIAQALKEEANGDRDRIRDHQAPWGVHRQGGFVDPFGHIWLVGDKSPLQQMTFA